MKKLLSIFISLIMVITASTFISCERVTGRFYLVKDAFEMGLLSQQEIQIMQLMHKHGEKLELKDEALINEIKEAWVKDLRKKYERYSHYTADKISFAGYYGLYNNNCYVITLDWDVHLTVIIPTELQIGETTFLFPHSRWPERFLVYVRY